MATMIPMIKHILFAQNIYNWDWSRVITAIVESPLTTISNKLYTLLITMQDGVKGKNRKRISLDGNFAIGNGSH